MDIDTGAVIFSSEMVGALYGLISTDGQVDEAKFRNYVNDRVRLSFYGDFLYPLAQESTLEQFYQEAPEGSFCPELTRCRKEVWEAMRAFTMKLLRLSPAKFIHFGTTGEVLRMMTQGVREYSSLGWSSQIASSTAQKDIAVYNGIVKAGASVREGSYIENSIVEENSQVGAKSILSYIRLKGEKIPDDTVLHGLKQKDGHTVVRIYGVHDNPKGILEESCEFLGLSLRDFLDRNRIGEEQLWDSEEHSLWLARLYPVCDTMTEAVEQALNLYAMSRGEGNREMWLKAQRVSLCAGFNGADPQWLIEWNQEVYEEVEMEILLRAILRGDTWESAAERFAGNSVTDHQKEWLEEKIRHLDFSEKMRLLYYMGKIIGGAEGERYIDRCFEEIQQTVLAGTLESLQENTSCRIQKEFCKVCLPLRVNWGGGWSDTPPYCIEKGGTVLNAAIRLNGKLPVQVALTKLEERKIVFESRDMGTHGEFTRIEELQECSDPYDPFALPKAALIACGVIPAQGSSLETILDRLGGGFWMDTEVTGVPKGSGLGTSSILAGACVRCLFDFLGVEYTEEELYDRVLLMEQLMSTGGGWQDQVGGMTPGIKYITSQPGLHQHLTVDHVAMSEGAAWELNNRFALIYTGQRRLARNLLRDVVGRYIGANPDALFALYEIQRVASLMRFELEKGNVDGFAKLLSQHWELSKKLDGGSTNTCIDQILMSVEDLICGQMISGAGGGGFLQVILKKGVTKEDLRRRLRSVFQDSGVDVWDCSLA